MHSQWKTNALAIYDDTGLDYWNSFSVKSNKPIAIASYRICTTR